MTDAVDGWDRPLRLVAGVLLWGAWSIVLVAVLAPRPLGLTAVRVIAPAAVLVTIATAVSTDALPWAFAAVSAAVVAGLLLSSSFAHTSVNAVTYGDEERFPLATPPAFLMGPVEGAALLVVVGIAAGPLLLAAKQWLLGAVVLVAGFAVAALMARSVHTLARRFAVVVPAGIVVADPLQLPDPVLMPRERVAFLRPAIELDTVPADLLDLRLGARRKALVLGLNVVTEPIPVRKGRSVDGVRTSALAFTVQWPVTLQASALASQRRGNTA